MKNIFRFSFLIITLIAFQNVSAQPKNWTCHADPDYKLRLCFPNTWSVTDTIEGARFFIFTPSQSEDNFTENFNVQAQPTEGQITDLKEYVNLNKTELEKGIGNFKKYSERYFTQKGVKWYEIVYSGKVESVDFNLRFIQRYSIYKGTAFVVTYTADGTKKDAFAATAMAIMNTAGF
jgi:hypothetical protein